MRVLVADGLADEGLRRLRGAGDVLVRSGVPEAELCALLPGFEALIVRSRTRVPARAIGGARRLRVIARAGIGVDNIDVDAATHRGILVLNAPESSTTAAAEHTLAMLLALVRHIPQAHAALAAGTWARERFVGTELAGKTLGIVGLGKIGSEVARRASAFGMRVLAYDPYVAEERARRLGVELGPWDAVLRHSDVLTLHVPLGPDTRALIGATELAAMKPGALLVNCARGGLVDEAALLDALDRGHVAGAALDVFAQEPPPADHPLLSHPRIVVTPHLGGSTVEAQRSIAVEDAWRRLAPFVELARALGTLARELAEDRISAVAMTYEGEVARLDTQPLTASLLAGLLHGISDQPVNLVNATVLAAERGLRISEARTELCEDFASQVLVEIVASPGTLRLV